MSAKAEALYDLYDCGRLDGRYSTSELMVMLGIRHRTMIPNYSVTGVLYRKRYLFERVDDEPISKTLAAEWDKTRKQILKPFT